MADDSVPMVWTSPLSGAVQPAASLTGVHAPMYCTVAYLHLGATSARLRQGATSFSPVLAGWSAGRLVSCSAGRLPAQFMSSASGSPALWHGCIEEFRKHRQEQVSAAHDPMIGRGPANVRGGRKHRKLSRWETL